MSIFFKPCQKPVVRAIQYELSKREDSASAIPEPLPPRGIDQNVVTDLNSIKSTKPKYNNNTFSTVRSTSVSSSKTLSKPMQCPLCSGYLRKATIITGYSGDGDYTYEDGFACRECRGDFVLEHGELIGVRSKGPARPTWWSLSNEEKERLRAGKGYDH